MLLTVEELKNKVKTEYVVDFKFVNVDGEYRYCDIMGDHSGMVAPGEKAISAGTIVLYKNKMIVDYRYSTSLKVKMLDSDEEYLEKAFGLPFKSRWE